MSSFFDEQGRTRVSAEAYIKYVAGGKPAENAAYQDKAKKGHFRMETRLIPQILTNQLDMDAVLDHVAFDDAPHVADPLGSFAITAQPRFNTGIF